MARCRWCCPTEAKGAPQNARIAQYVSSWHNAALRACLHLISTGLVFSLFWSGGLLDAAIDESQVDEILKTIGTALYNLTEKEKEEVIAAVRQREAGGYFDEDPAGLQLYLVILGDQTATEEAVAEFRKKALA